jgi:TRAP-type C4-dicarboxylate transport system permease small subunit
MAGKERWSLRNIYLYLVCLITLIMVIIAAVNTVRAVAELIIPTEGDPYYRGAPLVEGEDGRDIEVVEKEAELWRLEERRRAYLNLIGSVAMLLVAGPIYVYHWRKIEGENTQAANEGGASAPSS